MQKEVIMLLSDRQKLILKAIVEEYVSSGEPVGSTSLTKKPYLNFSSATLRYDMQNLEENGYLEKTHTSSGRAPSEKGYRYYVNHLLTRDSDVKSLYKEIDNILEDKVHSKEEILQAVINFVSNQTNYYCTMLGSSASFARVKKMEIVELSDKDALLLIVTNSGVVRSQKITIPDNVKMEDLLRIMSMFDVAMYDQEIYEIRDVLTKEAMKPRIRQMVDFRDDILNFLIKAFSSFMNTESYSSGIHRLFHQAEFQDYQTIQKILKSIDENKLSECMRKHTKGLNIMIGDENLDLGLEDCSIITVPYYLDEDEYGSIALVGPKRMNYKQSVPLMEYLAKSLPKIYK